MHQQNCFNIEKQINNLEKGFKEIDDLVADGFTYMYDYTADIVKKDLEAQFGHPKFNFSIDISPENKKYCISARMKI